MYGIVYWTGYSWQNKRQNALFWGRKLKIFLWRGQSPLHSPTSPPFCACSASPHICQPPPVIFSQFSHCDWLTPQRSTHHMWNVATAAELQNCWRKHLWTSSIKNNNCYPFCLRNNRNTANTCWIIVYWTLGKKLGCVKSQNYSKIKILTDGYSKCYSSFLQQKDKLLCVSKTSTNIFSCNSRKHCRIFIMFGTRVTEKLSNQ